MTLSHGHIHNLNQHVYSAQLFDTIRYNKQTVCLSSCVNDSLFCLEN